MKRNTLDVGPGALSDYYDWFKNARAGDVLIYWKGDLRFDRDVENLPPGHTAENERDTMSLDALASRIGKDAKDGYLHLLQRRIAENLYEYLAVRRWTPREQEAELIRGGLLADS